MLENGFDDVKTGGKIIMIVINVVSNDAQHCRGKYVFSICPRMQELSVVETIVGDVKHSSMNMEHES